ncbi:MAG: phasin family protein [Marinobacter sp.]|nr:phasin family protein [Marinobacter sp.]
MTDEHDKDTDADAQLPDKIKDSDAQLPGRIKDSARQIWLAGLGAFNKAEEDTGRFFERLVQEGEQMENRTRGVVEKQLKSVEDRVEGRTRARHRHLGQTRALCSISGYLALCVAWGMYRQEDVMTLEKRVERLEAELDRLKKLTPGYNEEE